MTTSWVDAVWRQCNQPRQLRTRDGLESRLLGPKDGRLGANYADYPGQKLV